MGLIAVGDLHGCPRTLEALLRRLRPTPEDELVFVGDYVDRGPDARGLIDYLLALEAEGAVGRGPRCGFLRGNHDQMMIECLERPYDEEAARLWLVNGGGATLESYAGPAGPPGVPEAHLDFLRRTRLYLDTPDFLFVHAGLDARRSVAENLRVGSPQTFLWERRHLQAARYAWEKPVVCGHTPMPEPLDRPLLIAIDTGAVYRHIPGLGRLTAVRLPERAFVSVPYAG